MDPLTLLAAVAFFLMTLFALAGTLGAALMLYVFAMVRKDPQFKEPRNDC